MHNGAFKYIGEHRSVTTHQVITALGEWTLVDLSVLIGCFCVFGRFSTHHRTPCKSPDCNPGKGVNAGTFFPFNTYRCHANRALISG